MFGIWDAFAVSDGHALVVTKRHVGGWFDATPAERAALTEGVAVSRDSILKTYSPDGFNIGINVGTAAGQTIPHLHVHVIPRYASDVADPRGGVRHVIPGRGNYLAPAITSRLPRRGQLQAATIPSPISFRIGHRRPCRHRRQLRDGKRLDRIFEHLKDLLARGGQLRILTGDYLGTRSGRVDASARSRRPRGSTCLRNRVESARWFLWPGLSIQRPTSCPRNRGHGLCGSSNSVRASRVPSNGTTASCRRARVADLLKRSRRSSLCSDTLRHRNCYQTD